MKSPLLVLLEWLKERPDGVRWWLASQSLFYLGKMECVDLQRLENDRSREAYEAWLSEALFACMHVGRFLHAAALIDFLIETRGVFNAESEREELEEKLDAGVCEAEEIEPMRDRIAAIKKGTAEWMAVAESWRRVRQSMLSADVLQAWEEAAPITHPFTIFDPE